MSDLIRYYTTAPESLDLDSTKQVRGDCGEVKADCLVIRRVAVSRDSFGAQRDAYAGFWHGDKSDLMGMTERGDCSCALTEML